MTKYLKTTCNLFNHCEGIDINKKISNWYGLHNIPITESQNNIEKSIEKYKMKPIQKHSTLHYSSSMFHFMVKIINKIFNLNIDFNSGGLYEKYKIYNIISNFWYYVPLYYLSNVLLYFNNYKSLLNIKDNDVISYFPNNLLYIFLGFIMVTIIFLISGFHKIFICLNEKYDAYYIFSVLYMILYIVIVNFIAPLFVNNIIQEESLTRKIIMSSISGIMVVLFIIISTISYIIQRLGLNSNITIQDSLYFTIFKKYISKTINLIITMLFISSICIKIFGKNGGFFTTMFLGATYFIYFLIYYLHIYKLLEGNNYNKIGLYTILLIVFLTIFCIFFSYEMVLNLENVCESEDPDATPTSPITMLLTIFTHIILIVMSVYLFGMVYHKGNWDILKYNFYALFIIYTLIILTSSTYTIKNSTNVYYLIWMIISAVQHRGVWRLFKFFFCIIYELFTKK